MGLLPDKFYLMDHDDFFLKLEGWTDQLAYQESLIRMHAAVIISQCSTVKKPQSIDKLWPKKRSKKKGVGERQLRILEKMRLEETTAKIREAEATKRGLEKLKHGSKNTSRGRG